jgi:hypothetical protein
MLNSPTWMPTQLRDLAGVAVRGAHLRRLAGARAVLVPVDEAGPAAGRQGDQLGHERPPEAVPAGDGRPADLEGGIAGAQRGRDVPEPLDVGVLADRGEAVGVHLVAEDVAPHVVPARAERALHGERLRPVEVHDDCRPQAHGLVDVKPGVGADRRVRPTGPAAETALAVRRHVDPHRAGAQRPQGLLVGGRGGHGAALDAELRRREADVGGRCRGDDPGEVDVDLDLDDRLGRRRGDQARRRGCQDGGGERDGAPTRRSATIRAPRPTGEGPRERVPRTGRVEAC